MKVDRREWLNDARDTHSNDIKDVRVILEEEEDVTVTRPQTLNRQRLIVLVKRCLQDSWVGQVDPDTHSFNLLCKHVRVVVLQMDRKG